MTRRLSCLCLCVVFYFAVASANEAPEHEYAPTVRLAKHGQVRGIVDVSEGGRRVYHYKGIRYGRAQRFRLAHDAEPWQGVWNATRVRFACPQPGVPVSRNDHHPPQDGAIVSSEDCLYLSVWRPADNRTGRAVAVYIHGGTFQTGTHFQKNMRHFSALGDVVGVAINYRLNVFGFLAADQPEHPGNLGLHDQILALRWVQENIRVFGGDPAKVTVFGESAGSMSIGALVLSPLTHGLFHRVIMESGAINTHGRCDNKHLSLERTRRLAKSLGYSGNDLKAAVHSLHNKSIDHLVHASQGDLFVPLFGDTLLPADPYVLLKNFSRKLDLVFGDVQNEGSTYVWHQATELEKQGKLTLAETKKLIANLVHQFPGHDGGPVADFYTRHLTAHSTALEFKTAYAAAHGDHHLTCPNLFFAEAVIAANKDNKQHKFYAYELKQNVPNSHCTAEMGVCHAMDMLFVFGAPIGHNTTAHHVYTEGDYHVSKDIIGAWTNFVKSGEVGTFGGHVPWSQVHAGDHNQSVRYLQIKANAYKMVDGFFKERCDVWRHILIGST